MQIRHMLEQCLGSVIDSVYPRLCSGCDQRGYWLCDYCAAERVMLNAERVCHRCGHPRFASGCSCDIVPRSLPVVRSAGIYEGWLRGAIRDLKYHEEPSRSQHLGRYLLPLLPAFGDVHALIPVPLHPAKFRSRGYNQARLLADEIARATGIPVVEGLARSRNTTSQTELTQRERQENVRDAFELTSGWHPTPNARYLLVDDVLTTGSTAGACAKALRDGGGVVAGLITVALDLRASDRMQFPEHPAAESTSAVTR